MDRLILDTGVLISAARGQLDLSAITDESDGLSNTTFRRHFPDIAREVGEGRRTPATDVPESPAAAEHAQLVGRNAKLRRENRLLRDHLDLAVANIARLTLRAHRLQSELEAATTVSRIDKKARVT
ncbi:MAG: hypothetical protein ACRDSE_10030 [Pseudonocardiaceae bacterium]